MSFKLYLYSDGGARGNPGPAAVGFVATNEAGVVLKTGSRYIGHHTNNQAEYYALQLALEYATEIKAQEVICHLDSELVAKQLKGVYSIKNAELQRLNDQVRLQLKAFRKVSFINVPREHPKISMADALVNKTLDEEASKPRRQQPQPSMAQPKALVATAKTTPAKTGTSMHVSVRTSNMQRSIKFYEKYFNLHVTKQVTLKESDQKLAFLQDSAGNCILELTHYRSQNQFNQARFADRIFDHLGFDVEDINKTVAAMKADGITVTEEPRIFDAHATIAFVDDPDGTRIELVQRR
jgi:lactoylglutathione lyase